MEREFFIAVIVLLACSFLMVAVLLYFFFSTTSGSWKDIRRAIFNAFCKSPLYVAVLCTYSAQSSLYQRL
jgi:hypothetical protein